MDDGDRAEERQRAATEEALERVRSKAGSGEPSLTHCEDCDAPIPEARQALGGVTRCTECQEIEERRARR